jgi:class 3 adenylate cyclase
MKIEVERIVEGRSPVGALWPYVANTERTNRAVGMAPVRYRPATGGAARFIGSTNLGGFDVEYDERPAEWEEERFFRIDRRMHSGPIAGIDMRFYFEPRGAGSQVRIHLTFDPKTALLTPILKMRARQSVDQIAREIERIDQTLARGQRPSLPSHSKANEEALGVALRNLRGKADEGLVGRLAALLREGDDVEVTRLRPYELADQWGVRRRPLLEAMLEGVKAGLFELRWEMICPSCRVAVESVPTLKELQEHGSCQLCDLEFGLETDEALEASFAPAKGVRRFVEGPFCIAGPALVPHVVSQVILPAGGAASMAAPREPGRYRIFVRGGAQGQLLVEEGAPPEITVDAGALPERSTLAPGGRVLLRNEQGPERHAKVERAAWGHQAVTARELSALATFRRLFSSELLRPGASLRVARVALFFSDLTASTQLYSTVGDAAAFRLVQDHFEVLFALIEQHGGALVKTIGDAVMAAFADELAAVAASMAILEAFEPFRQQQPHGALTHVKIGVFAGPCYVVTANGVLDYFGQTVNVAARLQGQAESGELVVSGELADEALRRGLVGAGALRGREEVRLKGVDGKVLIARLVGA